VTLEDVVEGDSYRIVGEGKGGAAGFAKGAAKVSLEEVSEGVTKLSYDVEAKVGGKLAQLGSRIIDGFAKGMADKFFTNFKTVVEGPADSDEPDPEEMLEAEPEKKKSWLKRVLG
jgi:carbon monoxide dehydrogenase subunit G